MYGNAIDLMLMLGLSVHLLGLVVNGFALLAL